MNYKILALLFSTLIIVGTFCQECAPGDTLCTGVSGTLTPVVPKAAPVPEDSLDKTPIGPKEAFGSVEGPLAEGPAEPEGLDALTPAKPKTIAPEPEEAPVTATGTPKIYGNIKDGRNYTDPAYNTVIAE